MLNTQARNHLRSCQHYPARLQHVQVLDNPPPRVTCALKSWNEESMGKAHKTVKSGSSVRRAADTVYVWCVQNTLQDRVSDKIAFGVKIGPEKYLTV